MKLPFISRIAFEQAVARAEAAEQRAQIAEQLASAAWTEAKATIADARGAMRDAIAMSRIASATMFGHEETAETVKAPSVAENDRRRARELAEARS